MEGLVGVLTRFPRLLKSLDDPFCSVSHLSIHVRSRGAKHLISFVGLSICLRNSDFLD